MSSISVWGVDHGVEISKKDPTDRSFKAQGIAYTDKAGRVNTRREMMRRSGLVSPRSKGHRAKNWGTLATHMGTGTAVGGALGAAAGRSLGSVRQGAVAGAGLGSYVGQATGMSSINNRARRGAIKAGIKNGDLQTGVPKGQITAFGRRKSQ